MSARLLLPGLLLLLAGCTASSALPIHTTNPASPTLIGDSSRPAQAQWLRTELYFSVGALDDPQPQVNAARWREFLDKEVTPRFPDGFTAFDAYGQWRDKGAVQPERLSTKVIVILHENTVRRSADIEAIRLAWKRVTGDLSVLRLSQPAEISF
ncbi:DUF3574 domain-containing protein [Pseudomonas amygdali]|uniref:Lipoprotein n=1 Tax=Pseudomonas amygdali pv. hibisci TaxID=251723 RepID=A0AB34U941_PSEA0|nr:DUF3574 domain-containing protein [Pseudomonas amygdali]KPX56134.1 hypothetical protein ALO67_200048 [Pseudomonas amygdali pv. hibisci]UBT79349.1 DUF3574 domain-containing protein [Pseudomonas amygdali]